MRELLARIDSAELTEWIAYATIEPFGPLRDDIRAGQVCATLGNIHRKEDSEPFVPADFFASLDVAPTSQEDEGVLLPDAEAQSKLLMAALFKKTD